MQGVKDYFLFSPGTWWVYEEETSKVRDCVYVYQAYEDTSIYWFRISYKSFLDNYEYRYWTNSSLYDSGLIRKSKPNTSVKLSKAKAGDFVSESYCFFYYPKPGKWITTYGGGGINYDNKLSVFDIVEKYHFQDSLLSNVVIINEEHTASENSQPTKKYYCPNKKGFN